MKHELSDDQVEMVVKALTHYDAYLVTTRREDARYKELAGLLQRKGPGKEARAEEPAKRKRG